MPFDPIEETRLALNKALDRIAWLEMRNDLLVKESRAIRRRLASVSNYLARLHDSGELSRVLARLHNSGELSRILADIEELL